MVVPTHNLGGVEKGSQLDVQRLSKAGAEAPADAAITLSADRSCTGGLTSRPFATAGLTLLERSERSVEAYLELQS